jgi:hypothetical protein
MKKTILILVILASIQTWALSDPAVPPSSQGFAASSANPRLPWWFANPPSSSQAGANLANSDLGARLVNLQNDLQKVAPLVASFNASLRSRYPRAAEVQSEAPTALVPIPRPTGDNYGLNCGQNVSTRVSAICSQNLSVPVGYTPPSPASASGFAVVVPPTTSPAFNPLNPPLPPPATRQNEFAAADPTSEAVRELLTLQADIQRLLPVVASLNNGGLNVASELLPENVPDNSAAAPNRFYASPAGNQPPLTPTGR